MRRFRNGKKRIQAAALMLIFSLLAGSFINSTVSQAAVKGTKETAIKTVSLKIGKKKVTKKTYEMKKGEKKKLKVSVSPQKGEKTILFTSSDKKVAVVNKSGYITAKKTGSARIKVTVKAGKKGAKVSVKKTTWVKIKVVKAATPDEPASSVTPGADFSGIL